MYALGFGMRSVQVSLSYGVIGNTADFDSAILSSNLGSSTH